MGSISSLGIGSGLDVRNLVQQLVDAERAPQENRIDRQQERYETEISALGQVLNGLSGFRETVQELGRQGSFETVEATSSNSGAVGASADAGAEPGSYDIQVNSLARAQSVATDAFESRDSALGTGTLTFRFGTVEADEDGNVTGLAQNAERATRSIEIDPSNDTLTGIRDAVNSADIGVRASIINDGSGERLVFSSSETGADNGFLVDVDSASAGLNRLAFNQDSTATELTRAGRDASLTVDGLTVTRPGNSVSDLIDGVTLELRETMEAPARIDISRDSSGAEEAIAGFVEAYNQMLGQINELTRFDPESGQAGPLNGNATIRNLVSQLRTSLTAPVDALEGRAVRALSDIGVLTASDGTLELDEQRLENALAADPDAVAALFSPTGIVEGSGFGFDSSRSATHSGRYAVEVSSLATRGSFTGAATSGFPMTIEEGDNSFRISVDGVLSGELSLRPGTYESGDELAGALQALVNGSEALQEAERGVGVRFDAETGRFVVTSQRYGSESEVSLVDVDAALGTALGLSGGSTAAGTDVQGTINGVEAEGFGQYLTGQTGAIDGLKLKVDGNQTGHLGEVIFSRGTMSRLDEVLHNFTGYEGLLRNQTETLSGRLERLEQDRENLDRRMSQVEARYVAQFSAMDQMVAQMNETSRFLSQQLETLNSGNNR